MIGKHEIEEIAQRSRATAEIRVERRSHRVDEVGSGPEGRRVRPGQATTASASAIQMARSGLGNQQKPIGSFLFSGPPGVAKTEVARQLAYTMGIELIRFDMSEYMERHAVPV